MTAYEEFATQVKFTLLLIVALITVYTSEVLLRVAFTLLKSAVVLM